MDADEIAEAQQKFLNQYDIGISASGVSAGLYHDTYQGSVEDDRLTQSQLYEVYLYFCGQVYDTDFTNALASHFGCNTKDVYVKHSGVLHELDNLDQQYPRVGDYGTWIDQQRALFSTKYEISLKSVYYMIAQKDVLTGVSSQEEIIDFCSNYVDTTGFERLYNLPQ